MDYSVENLEKAVNLFYKTEAGQQAAAHQWLTEAQNSPQAWAFVWELLNPQRSSEVQFFAATTLHSKLLKCWKEVPEDHYDILKKRILDAIVTYAMGPKIILNRLCIALSAYIIHTILTHWSNAFEELVSSFQPHNLPTVEPERVIWILLEILSVIPEEFQSISLATSHRNKVRTVLQNVTKDILKVTEMCLLPVTNDSYDRANLMTYLNATRCTSAWIQLGGITIEECSHVMDLLVDVTCYIYWNKSDGEGMNSEELELTEVALEALSSIMLQPQTHKYTKHVYKHMSNFLAKFGKILERERTVTNAEPNKDIVANIYSLIISVADTHDKLLIELLKSDANSLERFLITDMLNCILSCSNLPGMYPIDETSSNLTFAFWYTLQDDILALDAVECRDLLLMIKPYYRQLVCIMLNKSMYPNNWEEGGINSQWSLDDRETFRCYRQDVADTFMYCYNALNLEMLDILQSRLLVALDKCKTDDPWNYWNILEGCLHAFASVSECIEWENVCLPKLMETLQTIPYNNLHVKVLATALDTVGAYSEWMYDHPEALNQVVPLLILGLSNPEVAPNASMALKDVTHNCRPFLERFADHLLSACQVALNNEQLRLAEKVRLMHCLGTILSVLPVNRIMECLNTIVGSTIEEIRIFTNSPSTNVTVTTSLITKLKMLSALFGTLHVNKPVEMTTTTTIDQPILIIAQNMLPLYMQIAMQYCTNGEMMDVLCTLLKHIVTTLMDESKPLIPSILQLLVGIYSQAPRASILNISKTILIMFNNDEDLENILCEFLHEIINHGLQMCSHLGSMDKLPEKTDVFEGFFWMLTQLLKKNSRLLFKSRVDCGALFQCAIMCLSLPEIQTLKACTSFIIAFISLSRDSNQAYIVQKYGEALVDRILRSLGGAAPRSSADVLAEILLTLNKKYCDNLSRWLNMVLIRDGYPSHFITTRQKENFIKLVLKEKANKRKLSESVTEFSLICRGIIQANE